MAAIPALAAAVSNAGALGMVTRFLLAEEMPVHEDYRRALIAASETDTTGDIEALSMWAGQGVALAREPQSAADIVAELTSRL